MQNILQYNTDIKVKYHSIEQDLLQKIQGGETEYDRDDVETICHQLYQEEIATVFNDQLDGPIFDRTLRALFSRMKMNAAFVALLERHGGLMDPLTTFTLMFNFDHFYFLHRCIVSQLKEGNIPVEMLDALSVELFKNKIYSV